MGIHKTVLYPFSINSPYFDGYAWAMELALRLNARLQLFTTTSGTEDSTDSIYQSLLAAHGYYLHHFRHDRIRQERVLREQNILTGELKDELIKHLKNNSVDIMVIDPIFYSQHTAQLKDIIKESSAAIILSKHQVSEDIREPSITEHFYNNLRHAEFYKIPENFFSLLGHDRSVFNYLRKFFQKNGN